MSESERGAVTPTRAQLLDDALEHIMDAVYRTIGLKHVDQHLRQWSQGESYSDSFDHMLRLEVVSRLGDLAYDLSELEKKVKSIPCSEPALPRPRGGP